MATKKPRIFQTCKNTSLRCRRFMWFPPLLHVGSGSEGVGGRGREEREPHKTSVPVWKSYRYESRTGMKVVPVWKSYWFEIMSFQYSYRDELVPVWFVLVWNVMPVSCKQKHGHNKNWVELVPVWKSYWYHLITPFTAKKVQLTKVLKTRKHCVWQMSFFFVQRNICWGF